MVIRIRQGHRTRTAFFLSHNMQRECWVLRDDNQRQSIAQLPTQLAPRALSDERDVLDGRLEHDEQRQANTIGLIRFVRLMFHREKPNEPMLRHFTAKQLDHELSQRWMETSSGMDFDGRKVIAVLFTHQNVDTVGIGSLSYGDDDAKIIFVMRFIGWQNVAMPGGVGWTFIVVPAELDDVEDVLASQRHLIEIADPLGLKRFLISSTRHFQLTASYVASQNKSEPRSAGGLNSQQCRYLDMQSSLFQHFSHRRLHNVLALFHPTSRNVPLSSAALFRLLDQQKFTVLIEDHHRHDVGDRLAQNWNVVGRCTRLDSLRFRELILLFDRKIAQLAGDFIEILTVQKSNQVVFHLLIDHFLCVRIVFSVFVVKNLIWTQLKFPARLYVTRFYAWHFNCYKTISKLVLQHFSALMKTFIYFSSASQMRTEWNIPKYLGGEFVKNVADCANYK